MEEEKGLSGLMNLGNTCFLNSCMQALSHSHELTAFLQSPIYDKLLKAKQQEQTDKKGVLLIEEWNDLRKTMWSQNGTISPKRFLHHVQKVAKETNHELFTGFAQNDLPEFLLFLVTNMHNNVSRKVTMNIRGSASNATDKLALSCYNMLKKTYEKEYSEIMDLFYGIYVSELASPECNSHTPLSCHPEHFFILDVEMPVSKHSTLYDCLDSFTRTEVLEGDNAWYNEMTKQKERVHKRITFWSFPKVLVITLKRFSYDGRRKRQDLVDFPLHDLDLSKYVTGYNPSQYKYDLYAICNHMGGPLGGHYNAFVKTSAQWCLFDDGTVKRKVHESQLITPKAYCLFYRKQG